MSYVALENMSIRQLCKMSSRFTNSTFLGRFKSILQRCFQSVFYHRVENYLAKMTKKWLCKMSYIHTTIWDVVYDSYATYALDFDLLWIIYCKYTLKFSQYILSFGNIIFCLFILHRQYRKDIWVIR